MKYPMTKRDQYSNYLLGLTFRLLAIGCILFVLVGCEKEKEGPAEQVGKEIDETEEQFKTDTKDAKQEVEEKAEELANDAKRAVEDATD